MLREMGFMGIFMVNPAIISTLLVFSILLMAFFFERTWYFMTHAGWDEAFWRKLKACVTAGRFHEARTMCDQNKNLFARVFFVALNSSQMSKYDNEDLVQIERENSQELLRKRLGLFATLSFISPLVGLLGTVTGIMQAFSDLGRSGSGGANIVAAGISEALVATAAGIIVAVPAALLYNYFSYRLRAVGVKMTNHAHELIILMYGGEEAGEHKTLQQKAQEIRAKIIR
jgi:biopolymer transport protein ExbB